MQNYQKQDIIEKVLYAHQHFEVMKSFMLYRHMHKIQREHILGLDEDTTYINSTQTIKEYIDKSDWRVNANSNTGYSNAGLVNNTAGKVIANFWLDTIYSKEEGYSHRDRLSFDEIKKAIRSFVYNLNVPARWGQSPFTNITIDWTVPSDLKDQIPTRNQKHLFSGLDDEALLQSVKERGEGINSLESMTYQHFQVEIKLLLFKE